MNEVKICTEKNIGALAYTLPSEANIYLNIPFDMVYEGEIVEYYEFNDNSGFKESIRQPLEELVIDLLEHETIHIILNEIEGIETSTRFDNKVNGKNPETFMNECQKGIY